MNTLGLASIVIMFAVGVNCVGREPERRSMVSNGENKTLSFVYYLSPRVLTRTNMTPDRLKAPAFKVGVEPPLGKRIMESCSSMISRHHDVATGNETKYDFRLCVSLSEGDIFFDSLCKVIRIGKKLYLLSSDEETVIHSIFTDIDLMTSPSSK